MTTKCLSFNIGLGKFAVKDTKYERQRSLPVQIPVWLCGDLRGGLAFLQIPHRLFSKPRTFFAMGSHNEF